MKKIVLIISICMIVIGALPARSGVADPAKADTVRDIKNQPKVKVVKGRSERFRLQEKQIKYHDKQLKKVHKAQKQTQKGEQGQ